LDQEETGGVQADSSSPQAVNRDSLQETRQRQLLKLGSLAGVMGICFTDLPLQAPSETPANTLCVTDPVQTNLIRKNETTLADGNETSMVFERIGSNGVKMLTKAFVKRVDLGNSYKVISTIGVTWYPSDAEKTPSVTLLSVIADGTKGEVDGDYRRDTIRITTITGDGTVTQLPETVIPVLVNTEPFDTMSFQDLVQHFATRGQNFCERR
jgi:hypothetical protein